VGHFYARLAGAAALLTAGAPAALAQSAGNEAWIGQTGDTNTIAITQTGAGNAAGANAALLEINQDGRYNALVIDQFGWNNRAGADSLSAPNAPQGINQVGDRNVADVSQSNGDPAGSNFIGAILQRSLTGLSDVANRLLIEQDGDGTASHSIGYVLQRNTADDLGANVARLFQSGGLNSAGNTIERVVQRGYDNFVRIAQTMHDNAVGSARQLGDGNQLVALQGEGEGNTIETVRQAGSGNEARISESGNRNYVALALQNNERAPRSGNTLAVTLAGDDNGGTGNGGMGAFQYAETNAVSVSQSTFTQMGYGNDIRFTVNGGDDNLFGVYQEGDGNGAIIAIGRRTGPAATHASANEVAVVQIGDGNAFAATVIGNRNAVGATVEGDRNSLSLRQTGDDNKISVSIKGDDNNNTNSASVGGFTGNAGALAASVSLAPGQGLQSGQLNHALIKVSGDGNLFAFTQQGDGNDAAFDISGASNQSVVSQTGDTNGAQIRQAGTSNSMSISQF
jgi:hypothetical protein